MAFSQIIAHRIYRQAPSDSVATQLRPTSFDITGILEEQSYELKAQFLRKGGKHYGKFSDDLANSPIIGLLREYREQKIDFVSFSQRLVKQAEFLLSEDETLFDGYIFFLHEAIEAGESLWVFFVEHNSGNYLDADLSLTLSQHLDLQGFNLAAKIQIDEWETGNTSTYITLLKSRGDKEFADIFTQWIGFSDKHDIKGDTKVFLSTLDSFTEQFDEPTAQLTKRKAVDYCIERTKQGKQVDVEELSNNLAEEIKAYEPKAFSQHFEKQQELTKEFIPDTSQLRSYVRLSGRTDNLSMSFASACLGSDIIYDPASERLIIQNIPPALKARLIKHLKSGS